jgi:acyl carrier protein
MSRTRQEASLLDNATTVRSDASESEVVFQAVKKFLEGSAGSVFSGPIEMDTPLLNSALDSLTVLQLMMFLSDNLQFEIGEEDFVEEHFATVGTLVARIVARRGSP